MKVKSDRGVNRRKCCVRICGCLLNCSGSNFCLSSFLQIEKTLSKKRIACADPFCNCLWWYFKLNESQNDADQVPGGARCLYGRQWWRVLSQSCGWVCSPTVGLLTHSAVPLLTHNSAGPGVGGCLLKHSRVTHTYNAVLWWSAGARPLFWLSCHLWVGGCLLKEGRVMPASAHPQCTTAVQCSAVQWTGWCQSEQLFQSLPLPPSHAPREHPTLWGASWPIRSTKSHLVGSIISFGPYSLFDFSEDMCTNNFRLFEIWKPVMCNINVISGWWLLQKSN